MTKAIVVYLTEGGDLYTKCLTTEKQIQKVRDGEDKDVEEYKCYIIFGDDLESECHT